jgi:hypothetical protein
MKRPLLAVACGFALTLGAIPASAQNVQSEDLSAAELVALGSMFGDMFGTAEPLTQEEELRVPLAMQVVSKLMPLGTLGRVMDEAMAPMMDGMLGNFEAAPAIALSGLTGIGPIELSEVDEKNLEEAMALLDPDAAERNAAINGAFFELISEVMVEVEPAYRAGLARAYATRFTKEELLDLNAYFATEIGTKFAAESYIIYTDPQVMSSMNEMMPAVMQRMPGIMETITETSEKFPQGRSYSDLTDGEKSRLADLLGVSEDELSESEPAQPDAEIEDAYEEA